MPRAERTSQLRIEPRTSAPGVQERVEKRCGDLNLGQDFLPIPKTCCAPELRRTGAGRTRVRQPSEFVSRFGSAAKVRASGAHTRHTSSDARLVFHFVNPASHDDIQRVADEVVRRDLRARGRVVLGTGSRGAVAYGRGRAGDEPDPIHLPHGRTDGASSHPAASLPWMQPAYSQSQPMRSESRVERIRSLPPPEVGACGVGPREAACPNPEDPPSPQPLSRRSSLPRSFSREGEAADSADSRRQPPKGSEGWCLFRSSIETCCASLCDHRRSSGATPVRFTALRSRGPLRHFRARGQ
jgi:hypothetical protein